MLKAIFSAPHPGPAKGLALRLSVPAQSRQPKDGKKLRGMDAQNPYGERILDQDRGQGAMGIQAARLRTALELDGFGIRRSSGS